MPEELAIATLQAPRRRSRFRRDFGHTLLYAELLEDSANIQDYPAIVN
jgi:hypothetical protein